MRILSLWLILFAPAVQAKSSLQDSFWGLAAKDAGINVVTLYSIAVQETGMRWRDGSFRPWPWTLYVNNGKNIIKPGPRRYSDQQEAIKALTSMMNNGITNVDVGLMQVNLQYHGYRVKSPVSLLDPATNIAVAAAYLKELNHQNMIETVSNYHAPSNPKKGIEYAKHVARFEGVIGENK